MLTEYCVDCSIEHFGDKDRNSFENYVVLFIIFLMIKS